MFILVKFLGNFEVALCKSEFYKSSLNLVFICCSRRMTDVDLRDVSMELDGQEEKEEHDSHCEICHVSYTSDMVQLKSKV